MLAAEELILKLKIAQTTGNPILYVVIRLLKTDDPAATARALLQPMYGNARKYEVIQLSATDPYEVDIEASYDMESVISHLQSKIIDGKRDLIISGILYPTFMPSDDLISYPDLTIAYNSVSSLYGPRINRNIKIET